MPSSPPPEPPPRRAIQYLALGALGLGTCVALGGVIAITGNGPWGPDAGWLDYWHDHHTPALSALSLWFNGAGSRLYLGYILPAVIAVVLFLKRRPLAAAAFLVAGLIDYPAVNLLKSAVLRPRPPHPYINVSLTAYPSGHVANLVVLLALVGFALTPRHRRWWWPVAAILAVTMAFSRTYLDAHWLTDTVGGMLFGWGLAAVLWAVVLRLERLIRTKSSRTAIKTR